MDNSLNPFSSGDAELQTFRDEIKQWTRGIRCMLAVLNLLPLYYCVRMLLAAPRFESVLTDMLGSMDRMPPATVFVRNWFFPLLGGVGVLGMLSLVLIFTLRSPRLVWMTAVVTAVTFVVCGHLIAGLYVGPMLDILKNLSGGA